METKYTTLDIEVMVRIEMEFITVHIWFFGANLIVYKFT